MPVFVGQDYIKKLHDFKPALDLRSVKSDTLQAKNTLVNQK